MHKKDLSAKIARWALMLEEFDYEVCHRPGRQMKHVDALSQDLKIKHLLEDELSEQFINKREKLRNEAKENILRLQDENKKQYNKHRKPAYNYKPRDTVAIQRTQFGTGLKLRPQYFGSYEVTKVNKHDRYQVQKIGQHQGPNVTSTSADKMKKWCTH
ncbi:uncharacterized protein TNCV_3249491 [Trichonephila clavipes]|nr:uncharacterized protein TNCV_3249491 [Trichonephila clavipes]